MLRSILFTFICLWALPNSLSAQEVWSLEKCVLYAKENNIQLRQAGIAVDNAKLTEKQSKQARYPNIGGTVNYSTNFGRSIDPVTNDFSTLNLQSNSLSISAGVSLYDGFQIRNTIKQSKYDLMAAMADQEQLTNDLGLNIALAYLQVLLAEDQVVIAKNRIEQTKRQLQQTDILINAGSLPKADRYTIVAQIALDEQAIVSAINAVDLAYVSLKTSLDLDADYPMIIERPEIKLPAESELESLTTDEVYQTSMQTQPSLKADEYRVLSAEKGIEIAKGRLQPSLVAFANFGTNYSNIAIKRLGSEETTFPVPIVNQMDTFFLDFPTTVPTFADNYPYLDQLNDNFNHSYGVRLSIPIYNNGINRTNLQRAKLNVISTELSSETTKRQLKADVQRAIADAKAAAKELAASEKSLEAQEIAYDSAEKRYDVGATTTFEFTIAKDNLDIAKYNYVGAKYSYLFRLKVLDFYQGKTITLN